MKIRVFLFAVLMALLGSADVRPCSRVVFQGRDSLTVVGRTLDWRTPIPTNLYVYPRGMRKSGMPSGNTLHWTSKYGSVLAVSYDGGVTEGMNERALLQGYGVHDRTGRHAARDESGRTGKLYPR